MRLNPISSPVVRITSCLLAALAVVVFAVSVACWVRVTITLGPPTPAKWQMALACGWPAPVLLLLFATALALSLKGKRLGAGMLAGSLLLAALLFLHDVGRGKYDFQALTRSEGCRHYYLTWWWYVGPSTWEQYIPKWL